VRLALYRAACEQDQTHPDEPLTDETLGPRVVAALGGDLADFAKDEDSAHEPMPRKKISRALREVVTTTFGAPSRARFGAGHAGDDSSGVRPMTPGNGVPGVYSVRAITLSLGCRCEVHPHCLPGDRDSCADRLSPRHGAIVRTCLPAPAPAGARHPITVMRLRICLLPSVHRVVAHPFVKLPSRCRDTVRLGGHSETGWTRASF